MMQSDISSKPQFTQWTHSADGILIDIMSFIGIECFGILEFSVNDYVDFLADRIGLPVRIEYVDGRVFPVEHEAVRLARAMHPTSWRGGLQGLTIHDEVFAPRAAATAFAETESTGAVFVGPDWPVVTVHGDSGIDALVRRHRTDPTRVVFVQGPPGLGSALVPRHVVESVARRSDRDASP